MCAKLRTTDSVSVFGKKDTVSAPFTVGVVPASGQRGLMQKGICDQGKMNEQSVCPTRTVKRVGAAGRQIIPQVGQMSLPTVTSTLGAKLARLIGQE